MNCDRDQHNDYLSGCVFCEIENSAQRERERIIKLLERLWEKTQGTHLPAVVVLPEAIALIKGEQK